MSAVPYLIRERARWSDVDAAGIVCYASFLRFFELAETEMFREAGMPIGKIPVEHGIWLVRRKVECDFYKPVFLDEELEIASFISKLGNSSIGIGFFARHVGSNSLTAESRYVIVAADKESFAPISLSGDIRDALSSFHMDREKALGLLGWS